MIYTIIRCFRPKKLITALNSIKQSATEVGVDVTLALLLDRDNVTMQQATDMSAAVGLPSKIARVEKAPNDTYMAEPMTWAVNNWTKDNDWCIITDDDDKLLPGALEAVKENMDAEIVLWNTNNPYPYRSVMNNVHDLAPGRAHCHVGWPNIAFKAHLVKERPLIPSDGNDDGLFMEACLRDGIQPVYSGKVGCFYIAAVIQQTLGI